MHNAPLSFLIYLLYFKNSKILNRCELNICVYEVFVSATALELNSKVLTLTPGTLCTSQRIVLIMIYNLKRVLYTGVREMSFYCINVFLQLSSEKIIRWIRQIHFTLTVFIFVQYLRLLLLVLRN
jgi:hypothetical protein